MANLNISGKLPPHDLTAERSVIGSVLLFEDTMDDVVGIVTPEMFYLDANAKIFNAMIKMREAQTGIDAATLFSEMTRSGTIDEIGGHEYIVLCMESVIHAGHAKFHAKEVRDRWTQRSVIYICTQLIQDAYDGGLNGIELASKASEDLSKLLEDSAESNGRWLEGPAMEAMDRHFKEEPLGIASRFPDVDNKVGNYKPENVYVIGARPGMGKTAFVGNIACAIAEQGEAVAIFSLEMNETSLFDRFTINRMGTTMRDLKETVRQHPDQSNDVFMELGRLPIFINASPTQSMASITAQCRQLKRKRGLSAVVIDHLLLVEPEDKRAQRSTQVGTISWRAKQLAKSLKVPVFLLTQLNRECEKRPDKRPVMSDLRDSGEIEQNADCIMFLFRPAVYFPDDHKESETEVIITKNRSGSLGVVNIIWDGPSMNFTPFTEECSDLDLGDMEFN